VVVAKGIDREAELSSNFWKRARGEWQLTNRSFPDVLGDATQGPTDQPLLGADRRLAVGGSAGSSVGSRLESGAGVRRFAAWTLVGVKLAFGSHVMRCVRQSGGVESLDGGFD